MFISRFVTSSSSTASPVSFLFLRLARGGLRTKKEGLEGKEEHGTESVDVDGMGGEGDPKTRGSEWSLAGSWWVDTRGKVRNISRLSLHKFICSITKGILVR